MFSRKKNCLPAHRFVRSFALHETDFYTSTYECLPRDMLRAVLCVPTAVWIFVDVKACGWVRISLHLPGHLGN